MYQTNLAFKQIEKTTKEEEFSGLPNGMWHYLVKEMKNVFRFNLKEKKWFTNCNTAKLIATIPFTAKCKEPERTAIAHLTIYLSEIRGFQKYYAHLPSDDYDLYNRLSFISTFEGGDQTILEHGINLLAYIMIEGYHKSESEDRIKGIYNPFVSQKWNYEKLKTTILSKINNIKIDCLDTLVFSDLCFWI